MGVGGEKGEFGVGGGTVLNFFKKSVRKESNDPPGRRHFFSVSPCYFQF